MCLRGESRFKMGLVSLEMELVISLLMWRCLLWRWLNLLWKLTSRMLTVRLWDCYLVDYSFITVFRTWNLPVLILCKLMSLPDNQRNMKDKVWLLNSYLTLSGAGQKSSKLRAAWCKIASFTAITNTLKTVTSMTLTLFTVLNICGNIIFA